MNKSRKRPPTPDIDHRSTKRRKSYSNEDPFAYSTREIPWEEQKKLPRRFHEHGKGFWPALRIIEERVNGKKREYLIEWEPHPRTAEIFAPTWTPVANVNTPLREEWEHIVRSKGEENAFDQFDSSPIVNAKLRSNNRRIISDSLEEAEGSSQTYLAAESPVSLDTIDAVEISETQQPYRTILEEYPRAASRASTPRVPRSNRSPTSSSAASPSSAQASILLRLRAGNKKRSPLPARVLEYNSQLESQSSKERNSGGEEVEYVNESSPHTGQQYPLHEGHLTDYELHTPAQRLNDSATPDEHQSPGPSLQFIPTSEFQQENYPLVKSSARSGSRYNNANFRHRLKSPAPSNMSTRSTRQSPRLQVAVPNLPVTSPRVPVRGSNIRTKTTGSAPEISSPLAATAPELSNDASLPLNGTSTDSNHVASIDFQDSDLNTIQPASMHLEPTGVDQTVDTQSSTDAMPIQESIEEEPASSNEDGSLESKASSSQESLNKEQLVRQQDGLIMPDFPILGPDEYCLALPAEGKVQAIYAQTIKVKRKAILKFIHRRGSVNSSGTSATKTLERNDMIELVQRLHDTTTHIDLGLPGIPTQYTIPSNEHAAYAEYAGSKFVFLGCLVDDLMRSDCTIAIMAQSATQDLLEEYLIMKRVNINRHDRPSKVPRESQIQTTALTVELLSTKANNVVDLHSKPVLVIAFDASFETLGPQVKHTRAQFSGPLPILHLMVTNSSEHVERCLPVSMPSPIRLKLLVRATYQAHANLGGPTTYVEDPSDAPVGRPMDMLEFSKAIRKSPKRKLAMLAAIVANTALSDDFAANWTLKSMPELILDQLEDTPPSSKESRATSVNRRARSQTPMTRSIAHGRGRSQTPGSLAGTPNARKRLLEPESANNMTKKPRMMTLNEYPEKAEDGVEGKFEELERELDALRTELATERRARQAAETARASAEKRQQEWQSSLAQLQNRYEKRTKKSHQIGKDNKRLLSAIENGKQRVEKLNADNSLLKTQLAETKADLAAARTDLKSAGGDVAAIELAREESRIAISKATSVEKSLENTKRDFEFVRSQYQDASNRAAELASQTADLEKQNAVLTKQASDEKRRLRELSRASSSAQHLAKIAQLEQEKKQRDILLKRQEDEIKMLKRNRGVQTRGSSVQPGSPGPRSRQGSPAAGLLAPPSGSRASALRHER